MRKKVYSKTSKESARGKRVEREVEDEGTEEEAGNSRESRNWETTQGSGKVRREKMRFPHIFLHAIHQPSVRDHPALASMLSCRFYYVALYHPFHK